jgi:LysR family transcriptional activator of nhaA
MTIMRAGDELAATLRGLGSDARRPSRVGAVATLSRNFQIGLLRRARAGQRDQKRVRQDT